MAGKQLRSFEREAVPTGERASGERRALPSLARKLGVGKSEQGQFKESRAFTAGALASYPGHSSLFRFGVGRGDAIGPGALESAGAPRF